MTTIEDHQVLQFTRNVELLLQQKSARLAGAVTTATYRGAAAQSVLQFGEVDMNPLSPGSGAGQWKGDTVWSEIEHHQRWVFPSDFALSLPLSGPDQARTLVDPRSPYAEAMRAAYARQVDDLIISAANGPAKTGKFDNLQTTSFPADQVLDEAGGLTIEKIIEAKERLLAAGNDPEEERFLVCSEKQLSDLLKNTKVQSADFNTVRALSKGEIDTFVGFKFISTERLKLASGKRQCLAWVKSGLHFGAFRPLETKADERPDKNYVWQIYMRAAIGATRTQEKKVVQINCLEG
ncbi:MAG: hypothetical protein LBP55_08490 [Candidatus Adiutrix sp.]|jgi:hypothetical protein|nr:hypothetical protein [Candidatus Adiutrix sp.]